MDYDVENLIGAAPHERSPERLTYRDGYRERTLETRLGSLLVIVVGSITLATPEGELFADELSLQRTAAVVLSSNGGMRAAACGLLRSRPFARQRLARIENASSISQIKTAKTRAAPSGADEI